MSFQIQRPKDPKMDNRYNDIIQDIMKADAFSNLTEQSLLTRILIENTEEEKSLELCRKLFGMKTKGMDQKNLEKLKFRLDKLKSDISKERKGDFKRNVKELCDIDVFHEPVSMHIPKPTTEELDTELHQEAGRMLAYLTKRNEVTNILRKEFKSMKEIEESKGSNSDRARKRRFLSSQMEELLQGLNDVNSGISQIEKALKSLNNKSKVAYAKMIAGNFDNIKTRLFALIDKANMFGVELKECIREGHRALNSTPDYIDEECDICVKKEKKWDDRWAAADKCDPLTAKNARDFHTRFVRNGGMRGLVDQFKSFLSCETSDPDVALPTLVCSMTDPKRANNLYNLISENNFLKDFKNSLLKKCRKDEKIPKSTRKECMVCGVKLNSCSF